MENFIITIERGFGSRGKIIGKKLAKELGVEFFEDSIAKRASEASGINLDEFLKMERSSRSGISKKLDFIKSGEIITSGIKAHSAENLYNLEAKVLRDYAKEHSMVTMGISSNMMFRDYPNALRINIQANEKMALKEVMERYGEDRKGALAMIQAKNKQRKEAYKYFTGESWTDVQHFDYVINNSSLTVTQCVQIIKLLLEEKLKNS